MFRQTHRLCPACDARVQASAVQCPECESKLTPVRRFDTVRITLALTCVFVLGAGTLWALTSKNFGGGKPKLVAPRDWWHADSAGLAIDSALRLGADDSAEAVDSVRMLAGGRTEQCEPYEPQQYPIESTDRAGPVSIANRSDRPILLTFYHPDGEGWSTIQRRVLPGRTVFLTTPSGARAIARLNWGVQVDQYCVESFERVAGWTGKYFTITWSGDSSGDSGDADR